MASGSDLAGVRVLVAEDEMLVSLPTSVGIWTGRRADRACVMASVQ
jgi:hypothetical protein